MRTEVCTKNRHYFRLDFRANAALKYHPLSQLQIQIVITKQRFYLREVLKV